MRLGHEHSGLEFWLNSIQCHAPNAPIFVVGTHIDEVSSLDAFNLCITLHPIVSLVEKHHTIINVLVLRIE